MNNIQLTYSEEEMADVLYCSLRRVRELRKMGVLQGTKTGKGYVYHFNEIKDLFETYRGKDLPTKK